ncbi:YwqJ-related putative deaminase [Peribacillus sp. SCS-26]|uniref:YwqJ-related putative deaminase n=1 Tax=Paraperibacillus marinus TaxID=3115295 RepID=UPI003906B76D
MSILTVKTDPITQHLQKDYDRYCEQEETLSAQLKIAESAPSILAGEDYAAVQSEITALKEKAEKYINTIMPQLHSLPVNNKPMDPYKEAVSKVQAFIAQHELPAFINNMREVQQVSREDVKPVTKDVVLDTIGEISGLYDLYRVATAKDPDGRELSFTEWLEAAGWTIISFTPGRFLKLGKVTKVGRAAHLLKQTENAENSLSVLASLSMQFGKIKKKSAEEILKAQEELNRLLGGNGFALATGNRSLDDFYLRAEKIGDVKKGTNEVSNNSENLSRIEYLRNKHGRFTSQELNYRINLRGAVATEVERLNTLGLTKNELGPAVAGTFDKTTGKYYFGINNTDGDIPVTLHPIIRDRIYNMPSSVRDGYKFTYGAGSHAEVYSLNQALLANPHAQPTDFITHVVRSGKKLKPAGMMMPTCPHCNFITKGFEFSSEVKKVGK